jgi:hypothetical protein
LELLGNKNVHGPIPRQLATMIYFSLIEESWVRLSQYSFSCNLLDRYNIMIKLVCLLSSQVTFIQQNSTTWKNMCIVYMVSTKCAAFISHVLQLGVVMDHGPKAPFTIQLSP